MLYINQNTSNGHKNLLLDYSYVFVLWEYSLGIIYQQILFANVKF